MFLEKLDETLQGNDRFLKQYVPQILDPRLRTLKPAEEERYLPILSTALGSAGDSKTLLRYAQMSLDLSLPRAEALLNEARAHATDADTSAALERTLDLIHKGETRVDVLNETLFQALEEE